MIVVATNLTYFLANWFLDPRANYLQLRPPRSPEQIVRALAQSDGNKSEAATLLGMTRPRFYRRLVQLGMAGEVKDDAPQLELPEFIEHDATE
jgi:hypothetical protein